MLRTKITTKVPARHATREFRVLDGLSVVDSLAQHPSMLTADDLALALAMSAKTIYSQAKSGTLPCVRIGQSVRFDPQQVAEWLRSNAA